MPFWHSTANRSKGQTLSLSHPWAKVDEAEHIAFGMTDFSWEVLASKYWNRRVTTDKRWQTACPCHLSSKLSPTSNPHPLEKHTNSWQSMRPVHSGLTEQPTNRFPGRECHPKIAGLPYFVVSESSPLEVPVHKSRNPNGSFYVAPSKPEDIEDALS